MGKSVLSYDILHLVFNALYQEYPTNRLLQRLPIGKYSAGCVIAWGTVLACFAGVKNFGGAVAIRFFLGVCEAVSFDLANLYYLVSAPRLRVLTFP